jgi:predicted nucleic acid-binding protein
MPRTIVIDANVVEQIGRGNQQAADALRAMRNQGDTIYVTQQAYNEMVVNPAIPRTGTAKREFMREMNIQIAPPGNAAARGQVLGANTTRGGGSILGPGDVQVAAQARAINGEVWSFDRGFRNNAPSVRQTLGVQVAAECGLPLATAQEDYRVARRLTGLPPIEIDLNGNIRRPGGGGSGGGGGAFTIKPGDLPSPEPSTRGLGIVAGITILFEGINIVLNLANEEIQRNKVNAALEQARGSIAATRSGNRKMGVLLLFYYRQMEAGDSLIRPGPVFDYMIYGKGVTTDEARRDALSTPTLSQGTLRDERKFSQEVWLPPLERTEGTEAKAPFKPIARARFFLGNSNVAKFQLVKFNVFEGFDDICEKSLTLADDDNVDFVVLQAPTEVRWYNQNGKQTTSVPLKQEKTANDNVISVVDLDPWSPFSASGAMVFPANEHAERIFSLTSATDDPSGSLRSYINFGMLRWVRAKNIHLLSFL